MSPSDHTPSHHTASDHTAMRRDHLSHLMDHHRWRETLRRLHLEHQQLLLRVTHVLELHEVELDALEERIDDHELLLERHAEAMDEHEVSGDDSLHEAWARFHDEVHAAHEEVAVALARLASGHERRMEVLDDFLNRG